MKILIIDDDPTVRSSLELLLSRKGFKVSSLSHPSLVLETIEKNQPQLILLDMNFTIDTSGKQGLRLLKQIRESYSSVSVILMTGWATVQLAVEGMKLGAKDFVAKPWDNKNLVQSINNIIQLNHQGSNLDDTLISDDGSNSEIIGNCDAMQKIMSMVSKVAPTEASILITGDSGTGKELIAEAIHHRSKRQEAAFIKVNLGGIPTNLFESEMFGHKKGAFTGADSEREGRFALANKGTIFLDEIGELDLANQVKMLRVLQEHTFEKLGSSFSQKTDVRVICATNRNLRARTEQGQFREDLFYRINLINIHLPSLSERRSDIPDLALHFAKKVSALYNSDIPYIDQAVLEWLSAQEYKGNIRQLKNIIERTCLLNLGSRELTKKEFMPAFENSTFSGSPNNTLNLERMEIEAIRKALAKHSHAISASARALGITRSSLYRRLDKYGIPHESQT